MAVPFHPVTGLVTGRGHDQNAYLLTAAGLRPLTWPAPAGFPPWRMWREAGAAGSATAAVTAAVVLLHSIRTSGESDNIIE